MQYTFQSVDRHRCMAQSDAGPTLSEEHFIQGLTLNIHAREQTNIISDGDTDKPEIDLYTPK